ncbi:MAG TPA: PsbP-related protein [Thermoleophilia bacterium]|nr:PsbP-related protein [Thermoleophilia bacterium]
MKTRRLRLVLTMMALLLAAAMVVVTGCGGSSETTSTESTGAGGETTTSVSVENGSLGGTYSNAEYSFSFQYPKSWQVEEGPTAEVTAGATAVLSLGVYNPEGAIAQDTYIDLVQVSIYKLNVVVDESLMPDIREEVEAVVESLETQAGDLTVVEPLSDTTVNGIDGFTVTYTLTKNDARVKSTLYFLFFGDIEYQVTVQAAEENWDADKPIFDALIASFKPNP